MEPGSKSWRFGGGGETFVDPVIICAVLVAAVFILALPRKHVICALLPVAFLIPMDQVVVIGSLHFQMLRVVIFLGWVKLLWEMASKKHDCPVPGMNAIDKALLSLCRIKRNLFYFIVAGMGSVHQPYGTVLYDHCARTSRATLVRTERGRRRASNQGTSGDCGHCWGHHGL